MTSSSLADPTLPIVYVSLTSFIDYATATDSQQRLTVIRRVKRQMAQGYSPARDTYKVPREMIQAANGAKIDRTKLAVHPAHGDHSLRVTEGYNKFVGRKTFAPHPVRRKEWVCGDLKVGVNPEVALERDGVTTFYKLYFKSEPLTKRAAHTIYQMMFEMLMPVPDETIGVIDLRRAKMVTKPASLPDADLAALLRADAVGFVTLWRNLP